MLFNSLDFAVFLPLVFLLYWGATQWNLKLQNLLIVVASYVFYGWWDWRFLSLIAFSTLVDFQVGKALEHQNDLLKRKALLWVSLLVNLGFLGFFKYYNFFVENFIAAFSFFGVSFKASTLRIILPVGISFYTFQTLSYTVDVYRRKLTPTRDLLSFSAFVSFFPQLVAGPIERATNLLPQFYQKRTFHYGDAVLGLRQILWGFFKKVVIADNCAEFVNTIFAHSADHSGTTLWLGSFFFAFQIYGDFSGYSDIAIGTARLFGFKLMQNFAFPYFSRDIAEFWRRWHISLSTWFRDYLYIPLGGSRGGTAMKIRNTFVIFLVSGFWHGANWTFIVWGALNAFYFLPLLLTQQNRKHLVIIGNGALLPPLKELGKVVLTFSLTLIAWVFFRAENMQHGWQYAYDMIAGPYAFAWKTHVSRYFPLLWLIIGFTAVEWLGREHKFALQKLPKQKWIRWSFYLFIGVLILAFGKFNKTEFIYFAF